MSRRQAVWRSFWVLSGLAWAAWADAVAAGGDLPPSQVDQEWRDRVVMGYYADSFRDFSQNLRRSRSALEKAVAKGDPLELVRETTRFLIASDELLSQAYCADYGRAVAMAKAGGSRSRRELFDLLVASGPHWGDGSCSGKPGADEVDALALQLGDPARKYYALNYRLKTTVADYNGLMEAYAGLLEHAAAGYQRADAMYLIAGLEMVTPGKGGNANSWLARAREEIDSADYPGLAAVIDAITANAAFRSGDAAAGVVAMNRALGPLRKGMVDPASSAVMLIDFAHYLNVNHRPSDAVSLIAESDVYRRSDPPWLMRRARVVIDTCRLLGTPESFARGQREIQRVEEVLEKATDRHVTIFVHRAISRFYEAFGRHEAALGARKKVEAALEWQLLRSSETARVELQERLDVAFKDKENAQLKADAELQAERQRSWVAAFTIAALGVAAAGTALVLAVRRGRRLARVSAELAQRNGELEQRSASRIRLLAAACHDLRQPAHALGMLAELGSDAQQEPSRFSAWLQSVRRSTASLGEMLDELMDLGRLDGGHYTPLLSEVPLGELMQEVMLHFGPLAHRKGLTLQAPPVDVLVTTDRHLLRRILFNVVSNAIKYTDRGGVQVSIVPVGEQVRLSVQDSGPGIPPDKIDDVFRDYVRLNPTKAAEGLGIGLSIVRRAAELLGHELTLKSEPGQGTRVSLTLPLSAQAHEPAPAGEELWAAADGAVVAVVENDVDVRDAMAALLTSWGYRVCAGADAPTVMAHAAEQAVQPQLIITDLHLDNTDGLTEVARLREGLGMPALPALLVTGDLDGAITGQAALAGVYVAHKPLAPRKLAALVRQLIGAPVDTGMAARAAVNAEGR